MEAVREQEKEEIDLDRSWLIRTMESQVCVLKYRAGRLGLEEGLGGFIGQK